MNVLIDVGHPAHVHLFKNFAWIMQNRGHRILFTAREKEVTVYLLEKYGFEFTSLGKPFKNKLGKIWGLVFFSWKLQWVARKFKADLFLHSTMYSALVSRIMRRPHIAFEDTGNMEQVRIYRPFTDVILVPSCFNKDLGKKQLRYFGYHELAYLYPKYFQPDLKFLNESGFDNRERIVILRFVSWNASHDMGQKGLSAEYKKKLVERISEHALVFITSEEKLPHDLRKFQLKVSPDKIHDILFSVSLYIGEGATMASECAMLGTPAIYINPLRYDTLDEQEKFELVYNFRSYEGVLEKALEILETPHAKEIWQKRRERILAEKIDVTAFMIWFVENFPESRRIMLANPEYSLRFK